MNQCVVVVPFNAVAAMSRCEAPPFCGCCGGARLVHLLAVDGHIYPHQLKIAADTLCFRLGKAVWSYHDVAPSRQLENCR